MEALRNVDKSLFLETGKLIEYDDGQSKAFGKKIKMLKGPIKFVY